MDENEANDDNKNDFLSQSYFQSIERVTGNTKGIPFDFQIPTDVIQQREKSWNGLFTKFMEEVSDEMELDFDALKPCEGNDKEDNSSRETNHRVPIKKSLKDIQYWVDTGNLPYTVIDEMEHSENCSTISEDDDNLPVSPDKMKTGVSNELPYTQAVKPSQIEKSSSSSVDTAVYIKSNTNVTKKLESQALVEGSKVTKDESSKEKKMFENLNNNSLNNTSKNCENFENGKDSNDKPGEVFDGNLTKPFSNKEAVLENNNTTIQTNYKTQEETNSNEGHLFPKFNTFRKSFNKRKLFTGRNSPVELIYPTQISQSPTKKKRASIHPALDSSRCDRSRKVQRRRTMKRARLAAVIPEENSSSNDNISKEVSFLKNLGLSPRCKPINKLHLQPVVRLELLSESYINSFGRKDRPEMAGPQEIISEDNSDTCESNQSTILIYKCNNTAESDFSLSGHSSVDVEHLTGDEKEQHEQKKVQAETKGEQKIKKNHKSTVPQKSAKVSKKPRFQIRRRGGRRNSLKMKRSFNQSRIPIVLLERLPLIKSETSTSLECIDKAEMQSRSSSNGSTDQFSENPDRSEKKFRKNLRNKTSKPTKVIQNFENLSTQSRKSNNVEQESRVLRKKSWSGKSNLSDVVLQGTAKSKLNNDKRSPLKLVSSDEEEGLFSLLQKQMQKKENLKKHESCKEQSPIVNRGNFNSNKSSKRSIDFNNSSSIQNVKNLKIVSSSSSDESNLLKISQTQASSIRNRPSTRSRRSETEFDKESSPLMNSRILKRKKRVSSLKRRNNTSQDEDEANNLGDVECTNILKKSSVSLESEKKSEKTLRNLKNKGRNAGSNNLETCSKVVLNHSDVESLIYTKKKSTISKNFEANLSKKEEEGNVNLNNEKDTDFLRNFESGIDESADEFSKRRLSNSSSSSLSIFDSRKNRNTRLTFGKKIQENGELNRTETTPPEVSTEFECPEEPKKKMASVKEKQVSQLNSESNVERLGCKERKNGTVFPNFEKNDKRLSNRFKRQLSKNDNSSSSDSDSSMLIHSRRKSKIKDKEDGTKVSAIRSPTKKMGGLNNAKTVNRLAKNNSVQRKSIASFAKEDSTSDSSTFSKQQIPKEEKIIKQNVSRSSRSRVGSNSQESSKRMKLKLLSSSSEDDESVFWAIVQKSSKKMNKTNSNLHGNKVDNLTNSSIGNSSQAPVYRATRIADSDSDEGTMF